MSAFEFVFALLSIITSLGLAHLVSGAVALVRASDRVQFSWLTAMWMWAAFGYAIGNWGALWPLRSVASWSAPLVLVSVFMAIGQYALCAFATPAVPETGSTDMAAFYDREHRRIGLAALGLCAFALIQNAMLGADGVYASWLRDSAFTIVACVVILLNIAVRQRWMQWLTMTAIAIISTYFLVVACAVLPNA